MKTGNGYRYGIDNINETGLLNLSFIYNFGLGESYVFYITQNWTQNGKTNTEALFTPNHTIYSILAH